VDLATSLAEKEELRQVDQQEDCTTVLATDEGDRTEREGTPPGSIQK